MKISFSSLGCPEWSLGNIISVAKDLGYDGVEIRGIGKELFVPSHKAFLPENVENTKKSLAEKNLDISLLTSSCYLHLDDKDYVAQAKKYIDAAYAVGAKGVRVMGEVSSEPSDKYNNSLYIERLCELCDYNKDVNILIENNGIYAKSDNIVEIVKAVNEPNLGVIWDIFHPVVYFNESIEETFDKIFEYTRHVHIKDAELKDGKYALKMLGHGTLPVEELVCKLKENNFDGYVSLEWLKRWNSELEEPGIVFEHFISKIKSYLA